MGETRQRTMTETKEQTSPKTNILAWQAWFRRTVVESRYMKIATKVIWAISACYVVYAGYHSIPYYTHTSFGKKSFELGNYPEAEREFSLALQEAKEKKFSPKDPRLANAYNNLGEVYRAEGKFPQALEAAQNAYNLAKDGLKKQHQGRVFVITNLAGINKDLANYAQAEKLYSEGLDIWQKDIRVKKDSNLASIYNGMARLMLDMGLYKESQNWLRKAFSMREELLGENDHAMAPLFDTRGEIALKQGNYAQAEKDFRQAWLLDEAITGHNHPDVAVDLAHLGEACTLQKKYADAEKFLLEADKIASQTKGKEHIFRGRTFSDLGELYLAVGRPDLAKSMLTNALYLREKSLGKEHPYYATSLNDMAETYLALGQKKEAENCAQEALSIRLSTLGESHPDTASSKNILAKISKSKL